MLAIFIGGIFLLIAATGLPFYGYLVTLFFWGMCGGVAMSMGRTLMQESAPPEYRARVMSVFSLGSVGGMPMGSFVDGVLCGKHWWTDDVVRRSGRYLVSFSAGMVEVRFGQTRAFDIGSSMSPCWPNEK